MYSSLLKAMDINGCSNKISNSIDLYNLMDNGYSSTLSTSTSRQDDVDADEIEKMSETFDSFMDPSSIKRNYKISSSPMYDSSDIPGQLVNPNPSEYAKLKADSFLWLPSEPEDTEEDMELSVANNDEDDNYTDGIEWGQPNSFSNLDEDQINLASNKEKRKKAMLEAVHTQFKFLVSRFLASEGITSSEIDEQNKWVHVVSSLSWQAALLIKPDATEGKGMDPGFYVKVKCIACGSISESQIVKGLVFKKNIAHKHMPTNFKNARLLLLKGVLGERVSGFSSFNSMEQEKDYMKSVVEVIDICHPNVVLVEKTASRDAQESLLQKGITLVFDMKLPRLERIARCTGSRIIDAVDVASNIELKKCDSFSVEKFVEEHINFDGGKRPSKTLMFFEGCPKPLGCTILLKGAHSDELKKIKRVMQYTVFAAYHLILETSFFADQRAISFDMNYFEKQIREKEKKFTGSGNMCHEDLHPDTFPNAETMVPNGSLESSGHERSPSESFLDIECTLATSCMPGLDSHSENTSLGSFSTPADGQNYINQDEFLHPDSACDVTLLPGQFLSSFLDSCDKVRTDNLFTDPSYSYESLSSYYSCKSRDPNINAAMISSDSNYLEAAKCKKEKLGKFDNVNTDNGFSIHEQTFSVSDFNESLDQASNVGRNSNFLDRDNNSAVMSDTQSILILFSSRGTLKGTVCEQNQLSRIKYYGDFDMSLGRFLQDILLNQRHCCPGCGGPSEAHLYSYTHQNGKLTVEVRRLPEGSLLPGEKDGKLWMWTQCLKCHHESGIPRPTKRVIMSTAARGLSFGKFLELSFSSQSAAKMLSQCGHLLHRDCLRFFGFGSKVAMFRYSTVEIYTACKPPPVIEFNSAMGQEWFKKEAKDIKEMGEEFFAEVANLLQTMKSNLYQPLSVKGIPEFEEILKQEKLEFEDSLLIATKCHGYLGKYASLDVVKLTYLCQDLLLGLYVWDTRLCCLHLSSEARYTCNDASVENQLENTVWRQTNVGKEAQMEDIPVEVVDRNMEELSTKNSNSSRKIRNIEIEQDSRTECLDFIEVDADNCGKSGCTLRVFKNDISFRIEGVQCNNDVYSGFCANGTIPRFDESAVLSELKALGHKDWIRLPFPEMHKVFWKDCPLAYVKIFEDIQCHSFKYLASLYHKLGLHNPRHLTFPLGSEGIIISVREEEISSVVACALTKLLDSYSSLETPAGIELGIEAERGSENFVLPSDSSLTSSFWSSNGSSNFERMQSYQSGSSFSDEVSSSSFDSLLEGVPYSKSLHQNVMVTEDKATGKSKCAVVCIYAKQFNTLRKRCCSSELDYISSLSRCKKWDAQGGKSKAIFAKTLDDRFIIKEIKQTELDSFLKFGPEYFKHILQSLSSGSQTCLAKIMGIYQVKQVKGGKETQHALMVMENLLYGRDVTRTYDLKGAVYARYIADPNQPEKVLLDQNFVEDMGLSPMYIGGRTKHLLQRAIWNDTSFLTSVNVMDYSLLVGVDEERHELIFGIIDYLRQYTWDKQLETWVKSSLVPKNSLPTVLSPKEYKKRFRKFMSKYFLTVPDSWASDSCPVRSSS